MNNEGIGTKHCSDEEICLAGKKEHEGYDGR